MTSEHEQPSMGVQADVGSVMSRRRALAAGIGLAVVVASYGTAGLGDAKRQWAVVATIVVAVLLVDVLAQLRRLLAIPGVAPLPLLAALAGIYLCVPETDQIVVAGFLPLALVAMEVISRRQVGLEWYAVAAASVGWAGLFGSSGRQSAIVGALFAWWAVALVPLVHLLRPIASKLAAILVAGIGAVAVVIMARTGGIAATGGEAWTAAVLIAVVSLALAVGVVYLLDHSQPDGGQPDDEADQQQGED